MDFSISTDSTEVKLSGKMVRDKDANKIANALKKNTIISPPFNTLSMSD